MNKIAYSSASAGIWYDTNRICLVLNQNSRLKYIWSHKLSRPAFSTPSFSFPYVSHRWETGRVNTYVKVKYRGKSFLRTRTIENNRNPVWDEKFFIPITNLSYPLEVGVLVLITVFSCACVCMYVCVCVCMGQRCGIILFSKISGQMKIFRHWNKLLMNRLWFHYDMTTSSYWLVLHFQFVHCLAFGEHIIVTRVELRSMNVEKSLDDRCFIIVY